MQLPEITPHPSNLLKAISFAALLDLVLVVYGVIHFPTSLATGWVNNLGLAGVVLILAGYGLASRLGGENVRRAEPRVLKAAALFGTLAGLVFAAETLLEYILLPRNNSVYGLVEYSLAFALCLLAALISAHQTGKLTHGLIAGVLSAIIGGLIWYAATLFIFYLFNGSAQQALVFRAEGNYEDFLRSGMSDFNAFILQDFLGAGFFHLLFGPVIAAGLGCLGGFLGKVIYNYRKGTSPV